MQKQESSPEEIQRNENLMKAAEAHDLEEIQRLIKEGAHINYIQYTDSDAWYSGNTHTPLSVALESEMKCDEANFNNVIQFLLEKGADANFQVRRGGWNHCTRYPIYTFVTQKLSDFKISKEKLRLITMLKDTGMDLNLGEHHARSKNHRGYQMRNCFVFKIMDQCGMNSRLFKLKKMKSPKVPLYEL